MKRLNNILLIALGVVLASCTKAPIGGDGSLPKGAATITIQMPKQPDLPLYDEAIEAINNLKIFLFDPSTKALEKVFTISRPYDVTGDAFWNNATATLVMKDLENPANPRIVYVVANWYKSSTELAKITNLDQLEAAVTDLSGQPITTELLMSGKVTHTFSSAKALTVKVKRQAVCIDLTVALDPKFTAAYPNLWMGAVNDNLPSAELRNAPNQSYLCEQPTPALPAGNTMFNYPTVDMRQEGMMGITRTWHATFYVYENPVSGPDDTNATYIIVKMPYQDPAIGIVTENYYKFRVSNQYGTRRNKLYRIAATVLGFGKSTNSRSSIDDIPVIETTTTQIDL
ncbi:MAG: fimbrial protein [Mucinivorans sp.]